MEETCSGSAIEVGLETVEKYTVGHPTSWHFYFDLFVTKMVLVHNLWEVECFINPIVV